MQFLYRAGLAAALAMLPTIGADADVILDGVTYHTTDPGDATHGNIVEIDDDALSFLASFDSGNESNATTSADVLTFLANQGSPGVAYLGRNDGSGDLSGTSVTTSSNDGGLSGAWSYNPGSTGNTADFVLIHGGGGTINYLYAVAHPGLTGVWDTSEAVAGAGNQSALSFLELYGSAGSGIGGFTDLVPEPAAVGIFAAGIAAVGVLRRRRPAQAGAKAHASGEAAGGDGQNRSVRSSRNLPIDEVQLVGHCCS